MNQRYNQEKIFEIIGRNVKRFYDELPENFFGDNTRKIDEFAKALNLSTSFIYHLFSGKQDTQRPSFMTLIDICNFFDISMDKLLEEEKKDTI